MARELVVRLIGDDASLRRAFLRSSTGAKEFERDVGRASRGALAGSGAFKSLGRSIAFASGGFLAFASAGQFLRKSVDAAKEAAVVQKQLEAQFTAAGKSLGQYEKQIDHTANRLALLAGFENDEVKAAFLTIFRTTGNVGKALRDTATAADLARAKHIGLAQSALIVAKTEAGNTTLLRRQGFAIAKNASVTKALAQLRQTVAGQARAGTTEQERFGAVLHDTEEIIGTGILPVLNKYLAAGSLWLAQMNESGKLQKEVASAADGFKHAIEDVAGAVRTVDKLTGGFKQTLEALLGLKVGLWAAGMARNLGLVGASAVTAKGEVAALQGGLLGLGAIAIAPIVIPIEVRIAKNERDFIDKHAGHLGAELKGLLDIATSGASGNVISDLGGPLLKSLTLPGANPKPLFTTQVGVSAPDEAQMKATVGRIKSFAQQINAANAAVSDALRRTALTAAQRNTFFDNAISRILLRGGLGTISQQIGALQRADRLISARLRVTKDVTRKLNLEDQLLQNAAQIRDLQAQQAADALQARQEARQRAIEAIQRRLAARTSHQFRELGLSATGDAITPGVANLKKQLASLGARVAGTNLDTPKLQAQLARFRKVLSEGLVPKDVRAKIRDMLDEIRQELGKGARNLTKSSHLSSASFVNALGLNLTRDQKRRIEQVFSQVGAGGTVPSQRGLAFSGAGAQTIVVDATFQVDKQVLGRSVTKVQAKDSKRRTKSRRGTNAGR